MNLERNPVNQESTQIQVQTTYKQALRGLFTAGTSLPIFWETKEKVGGKQGLKSHKFENVLITCGAKPQKDERNYW